MTNLRKAIFYVQQSLRHDHNDNIDLLYVLDLLCEFDKYEKLNGEIVKRANDWESLRNKGLDTKLTMDEYNKSDDPNHE